VPCATRPSEAAVGSVTAACRSSSELGSISISSAARVGEHEIECHPRRTSIGIRSLRSGVAGCARLRGARHSRQTVVAAVRVWAPPLDAAVLLPAPTVPSRPIFSICVIGGHTGGHFPSVTVHLTLELPYVSNGRKQLPWLIRQR